MMISSPGLPGPDIEVGTWVVEPRSDDDSLPQEYPIPEPPQIVTLGDTITNSGLDFTVNRIEYISEGEEYNYNSIIIGEGFSVYFTIENNTERIYNFPGFEFIVSPIEYEVIINELGYGHYGFDSSYIYPSEIVEGFYHFRFDREITINELTMMISSPGFMGPEIEVGTWVITEDESEELTLSGTISLPNNETAPEGGVLVRLSVDEFAGQRVANGVVLIPEGSNSTDYSVVVTEGILVIEYYIDDGYDYIKRGYYNEEGTTVDYNDCTRVNMTDTDIDSINIELLKGNEIAGSIFLPEGELAPEGGMFIELRLAGDNQFYSHIIIPEGENSSEYSIRALSGVYVLEYSVNPDETIEYIQKGYFGSPNATPDILSATTIELAGSDISGVNIEMLKGNLISGTISLANGDEAPSGGIGIVIDLDSNDRYSSYVLIPEGENAVDYKISVPNGEYIARYFNSTSKDFVRWAYYGESSLVSNSVEAYKIIVSGEDVPNIDMDLVVGYLVSGTVYIPEGIQNITDGIVVIEVGELRNDWINDISYVTLENGDPINYEIRLLEGAYKFSTIMYHNEAYSNRLYYNSIMTTPNILQREIVYVPMDEDLSVDMNLYRKVDIESTYPIDGQLDYYPLYSYMTLKFSEDIRDLTSSELGRIELTSVGGEEVLISEVAAGTNDKTNLLIIVNDSLDLDTNYTLSIPANTIKSVNEIPYEDDIQISFKTAHTVLKGQVTSDSNIEGSKLELIDIDGITIAEWTLTDGGYRFINMDGGTYTLRITNENGDVVYTEEIDVVGNLLNQKNISFSFPPI